MRGADSRADWPDVIRSDHSAEELLDDPNAKFELMQPLGKIFSQADALGARSPLLLGLHRWTAHRPSRRSLPGRGSYGAVYKACVIETGEIVAIKIIPLTEQDEMESIQKEIAMLRDCNHPNVVRYYGSWRTADSLWIAMEYCAAGSVSDIMQVLDSPLEEAVISYICGETLAGLAYLHSRGRVHRDIKCGNILLTEGGEVKLADFGVAAQLTSTLSKRNTFIGTPHWMAPEVIQASHYDGKVDIWALGISSIEMAERYPPRWRVNPNRVIFMVVRDPPPRLAEKERWTLAFQDFIAQCLNKNAASRPTARYLQQHRFIAKDRAAALRALLPAIHRARAEYALLAEPALAGRTGNSDDQGYFSWKATAVGPGGRPSSGAASGTVVTRPASGAPGIGSEASATLVMRDGWSGAQPSGAALGRGSFMGTVRTEDAPALSGEVSKAASAAAEASVDYLAAVQAAATGPAGLDPGETVSRRVSSAHASGALHSQYSQQFGREGDVGAGTPSRGPQAPSEVHRLVERLYNVHSSGEVVPLPFLQATDLAPLALLGIEPAPKPALTSMNGTQKPGYEGNGVGVDWQGALLEILEEGGDGAQGRASATATPGSEEDSVLPPALMARVKSSPVLLNLAVALARHRAALRAHQTQGSQPRVLEFQQGKVDALSDTLRTILCL